MNENPINGVRRNGLIVRATIDKIVLKSENKTSDIKDIKDLISVECWNNFQKQFESDNRPIKEWWNKYSNEVKDIKDIKNKDLFLANLWYKAGDIETPENIIGDEAATAAGTEIYSKELECK